MRLFPRPGTLNSAAGRSAVLSPAFSLGSVAAPPFEADLVLRLDDQSLFLRSDGVTPCADGDPCGRWSDLSGNGLDARQTSAGLCPTYRAHALGGRPGLDFSGAGKVLSLGAQTALNQAQSNGQWTVVLATIAGAANGTGFAFAQAGGGSAAWYLGLGGSNRTLGAVDYMDFDVTYADRGVLAAGEFSVWGAAYDTTKPANEVNRIYVDGVPRKSYTSSPPYTAGPLLVGASNTSGASSWPGKILGVLVYRRRLSSAEYWQAAQYLYGRFGQVHPATGATRIVVWDGNGLVGQTGTGWLLESTASALGDPLSCHFNLAWGGSRTVDVASQAAELDQLLAVLPAAPRKVTASYLLTNEMNQNTPAVTVANLEAYGTARKSAGWPWVVTSTCLPFLATGNTSRAQVNASLRTQPLRSGSFDALADPAADPVMGVDGVQNNAAYFVDGINPTKAGYALIAPYFASAIRAAPSASATALPKRWCPRVGRRVLRFR